MDSSEHPSLITARRTSELWNQLKTALTILISVLVTGTVGYTVLGLSLLDALYQTVITVSTVGFREVGDVTTNYKIFTLILIMAGAGSVLYTFGVLIETLLEGQLTHEFGRRRMERNIDNLSDHVIVCGWGQVGESIAANLTKSGKVVVVVDRRDDVAEGHLRVMGDATDDTVLEEAGLSRADALVVALNSDADAVYVTLSGRAASSAIFIVARANANEAESKLYRAGADQVVNPHRLGGAHMATLVSDRGAQR